MNKNKIHRQVRYMKYQFDRKYGAKVDPTLSYDGNRGSIGNSYLFRGFKRLIGLKNMQVRGHMINGS